MANHILSIEGNIGTGKSTIIKTLKEIYKANKQIVFVDEPLDGWKKIIFENQKNLLQNFYEDKARWGYLFQMEVQFSRTLMMETEQLKHKNCIIITERSVFADKNIFMKSLYESKDQTAPEYLNYVKWFDWLRLKGDITPQTYLYLQSTPEVTFARVRQRDRPEEADITLEYLTQLHDKHQEWLLEEPLAYIVDNNTDCLSEVELAKKIDPIIILLNEILEKMNTLKE